MLGFLRRWFGWQTQAEAVATPAPPRVEPAALREPVAAPQIAVEQTPALHALAAVGARRPLVSAGGRLVGFEFCLSPRLLQRLDRKADAVAQAAHVAALLSAAQLVVHTGRMGLARIPADWLSHVTRLAPCKGVHVSIDTPMQEMSQADLAGPLVEAAQHLRSGGALVGWDARLRDASGAEFWLEPDFVFMRQGEATLSAMLESARMSSRDFQDMTSVASDMASLQDLEAALQHGVTYVCGALVDAVPAAPGPGAAVPPEVQRVGHLMSLLLTDAPLNAVVDDIKGDVGLSFRLLSRLGSASMAQLHHVSSIDEAVLLIGRNELYRWLSVLLLQFGGRRKASSALEEVALWRGRFLELLAQQRQEPAPGQMFTLGLASRLGQILQLPPADMADTLKLPEAARQALLAHEGPWWPYLQLADWMESAGADDEHELLFLFGGASHVAQLSDQAWKWAADHVESGQVRHTG